MLMRSPRSTPSMCCMSVPRIVDRDGHSLLIHARADACRLRSSGEGSRQGKWESAVCARISSSRAGCCGLELPHIFCVVGSEFRAQIFIASKWRPGILFYELACEKDIVGNGASWAASRFAALALRTASANGKARARSWVRPSEIGCMSPAANTFQR